MIASHNSFTYCKPAHWWMYLILPFSRCQNKTISQQMQAGAVMLDLRLKSMGGSMRVAHGLYVAKDAHYLADLARYQPEYCRVYLESRRPSNAEVVSFVEACSMLESAFPYIKFCGGHGAHESNWGKQYYTFKNSEPYYTEYHASVCGGFIPYLWSRRNNQYMPDSGLVMIDYID